MKKVGILLATYRPNDRYLIELLKSINNQTYKNIELFVCDDSASPEISSHILDMLNKFIRKFHFEFDKNEVNEGSNKTFEKLTQQSNADYLAFCDQDDIWEIDKIEHLVKTIETQKAVLCYSDLSVINSDNKLIFSSFRKIKKRAVPIFGDDCFKYLLSRSSVTGCTILVKSKIACEALPFFDGFNVHDQWLAFYASSKGRIAYVALPLVRYRIHKGNQIGANIFDGITSKKDYIKNRLAKEVQKCDGLLINYHFTKAQIATIKDYQFQIVNRMNFLNKRSLKGGINMIEIIKEDPELIIFEFLIGITPIKINEMIFKKLHHRRIGKND